MPPGALTWGSLLGANRLLDLLWSLLLRCAGAGVVEREREAPPTLAGAVLGAARLGAAAAAPLGVELGASLGVLPDLLGAVFASELGSSGAGDSAAEPLPRRLPPMLAGASEASHQASAVCVGPAKRLREGGSGHVSALGPRAWRMAWGQGGWREQHGL